MNKRQQAARDLAVARLSAQLNVGAEEGRDQRNIETIVDAIIEAATPGRSKHADAVAEIMKPHA
jgi:hypothetical protein